MGLPGVDKRLLANRDNWLCVKEDRHTRVYHASRAEATSVLIKEYSINGFIDQLSLSRKIQRLEKFYRAINDKIPTAKLLMAEIGAKHLEGFCVYEMLPGRDFRKVDWSQVETVEAANIGTEVGQLLKNLHTEGWVHGDFKFGNLLYNTSTIFSSTPKVYLIDLEGITRPLLQRSRKQARDIARFVLNGLELQAPAALLMSFWQSYIQSFDDHSIEVLEINTLNWLKKLAARHANQYGRQVDLSSLPFAQPSR